MTTGDRNKDLFNRSKLKNKQNKESNDYWYERQGDECKFKPQINKAHHSVPSKVIEVKGMDKIMQRMKQGREAAEIKRRMTERSNFAPVANMNKARRQIEQGRVKPAAAPLLTVQVDNSKYKSAFGADGAQIVPRKKSQFQAGRPGENRAPLHLPKQ